MRITLGTKPSVELGFFTLRRYHASGLAGLETLPCIVRNLDDDAAITR